MTNVYRTFTISPEDPLGLTGKFVNPIVPNVMHNTCKFRKLTNRRDQDLIFVGPAPIKHIKRVLQMKKALSRATLIALVLGRYVCTGYRRLLRFPARSLLRFFRTSRFSDLVHGKRPPRDTRKVPLFIKSLRLWRSVSRTCKSLVRTLPLDIFPRMFRLLPYNPN